MATLYGPDGRPVKKDPEPVHKDAEKTGGIQHMPKDVIDKLDGMVGKTFSAFGCIFILGMVTPNGIACGFVEETKKAKQLRKKKEGGG